jgi:acetone carboxylase gamma subunit
MKLRIGEYLEINESFEDKVYRCRKCGHTFCSTSENYKNYTLMREVPLNSLGSQYSKTERFCFREFFCPGCVTLLWVDMTEKGLPILFDHELEVK